MSLTTDVLHELFDYKEGKLYRKVDRGGASQKGTEVGRTTNEGYIETKINGTHYRVHRLIYQMFKGHISRNAQVDHINGIRDDNRIENLRLVTSRGNQWNRHTAKGYTIRPYNRYEVSIKAFDKKLYIGSYGSEEEATAAYKEAKEKYHKIHTQEL